MRYKDIPKVPFVYVPCNILPGMIAIPVSELKEQEKPQNQDEQPEEKE